MFADHVRLRASLRLHHRRFGGDLNLFRNLRYLHGEIDRAGLPDIHHNVFRDFRLEARLRHAHAVVGRWQSSDPILAVIIRGHCVLDAFANISSRNSGVGDDGARRIGNGASEVARGADTLCEHHAA